MRILILCVLVWFVSPGLGLFAAFGQSAGQEAARLERQTLFAARDLDYHTFRIPSLVVTPRGTVLALAEARKNDASDLGNVDLVLRRSLDGGRTWQEPKLIADDGDHTIGNPCPVVDRRTGTIWLPYCRDNRQVWLTKSTDDGQTWAAPVEITAQVVDPAWHWVGTGPGHGIQLSDGRLVIPCWADATPQLGEAQLSFVFFSDDGGQTWQRGGALDRDASDECEVVERVDGVLYLNARSRRGKKQRAVATSHDRGQTWSPVTYDPRLPELSCQGSLARFSTARDQDRNRLLLATPASQTARAELTLRLSTNEGHDWPVSRVVEPGMAGYSDLAVTLDGSILLLYESHDYTRLTLARCNLEWLTEGRDSPVFPWRVWTESRTEPRPLRLHWLRLDLQASQYEVDVAVGKDPDGDGPVEARLTPPRELAGTAGFVAALNTNAWEMLPRPPAGVRPIYLAGGQSDILGWARTRTETRSPPQPGFWMFWLDAERRGHLGPTVEQPREAVCAVAGFGGLLREARILPGEGGDLHPRSALGLDATGRWLTWLVVDGRQRGYSEGVSERELAVLMQEVGCREAFNLDGGGSSILLLGRPDERLEILNRPSDPVGPRPVPVMLGVRRR
ncbi:MAG: exo-alpha-sialidase [Planctomycetaceae bacterium]